MVEQRYHHSNEEMCDSESILKVMKRQEENFYTIDDYFRKIPTHSSEDIHPVDAYARQRIAKWCTGVIKAFNCHTEIVEIAMSCLDRFVSTENGKTILLDRSEYQLAALTALYTSVKIHNSTALSPGLMAQLSRHQYNENEIEAMERRMLDAIQWRVNPPTATAFVRAYLDMSPVWKCLDTYTEDVILELVRCQTNLSIIDFELSTSKASHIAIASLLNATKSVYSDEFASYESIQHIITTFSYEIDQESLEKLQLKLYEGMVNENDFKIKALDEPMPRRSLNVRSDSFTESPRSVYECNTHTI